MATTTNKSKASAAAKAPAEKPVVDEAAIERETKKRSSAKPIIPKDIDPTQYVVVRNGFQGRLVYKSPRTGERFVWDEFGDEQEMELRELRNARNSYKKFFENNWFLFDEPWIIDYLGVRNFYKNALTVDDFDDLFSLPAGQLADKISKLSAGQKRSVVYRAKEFIADKKIDSLSVIDALEKALGVELIEK